MIPLSILDLAPISAGSDPATALRNTIELAQHAEYLGYRRYWVAEHHFVAVASAAPAVLIGQIAANTKRIQVGAAAVQLGYTTAVAVVESFGMLDAFYPGRIDLGIGRSGQRRSEERKPKPPREHRPPRRWHEVDGVVVPTPFDVRELLDLERLQATMEILQQPEALSPDFAEQVGDILALLEGRYRVGEFDVHAVPGEGSGLRPWIFGSTRGQSARVAGALGLPFVASYHITPATALEAIEAYRDTFQPSAALAEPYVVVSADIVVAEDTATARQTGHRLRPLGVLDPHGHRGHALPRPRGLPTADRRAVRGGERPAGNTIRRRSRRGRRPARRAGAGLWGRRTGRHLGYSPASRPTSLP